MTDPIPSCSGCQTVARWSICNLEGSQMQPVVRAFACGRHLHSVLDGMQWEVDAVQIYDFQNAGERS